MMLQSKVFWACVGVLFAGAIAFDLSGPAARAQPVSSPGAARAPAPAHFYAYDDGAGHYGYAIPLSDEDRARGIGTKPYAMFLMTPHSTADVLEFRTASVMRPQFIRCKRPCTSATTWDGVTGGSQTYPVEPGTVLWELVQDGLGGKLKPATTSLP